MTVSSPWEKQTGKRGLVGSLSFYWPAFFAAPIHIPERHDQEQGEQEIGGNAGDGFGRRRLLGIGAENWRIKERHL